MKKKDVKIFRALKGEQDVEPTTALAVDGLANTYSRFTEREEVRLDEFSHAVYSNALLAPEEMDSLVGAAKARHEKRVAFMELLIKSAIPPSRR